MTREDHALQLQLVTASLRLPDDRTTRHGTYAARSRETGRTGPPAPLLPMQGPLIPSQSHSLECWPGPAPRPATPCACPLITGHAAPLCITRATDNAA